MASVPSAERGDTAGAAVAGWCSSARVGSLAVVTSWSGAHGRGPVRGRRSRRHAPSHPDGGGGGGAVPGVAGWRPRVRGRPRRGRQRGRGLRSGHRHEPGGARHTDRRATGGAAVPGAARRSRSRSCHGRAAGPAVRYPGGGGEDAVAAGPPAPIRPPPPRRPFRIRTAVPTRPGDRRRHRGWFGRGCRHRSPRGCGRVGCSVAAERPARPCPRRDGALGRLDRSDRTAVRPFQHHPRPVGPGARSS